MSHWVVRAATDALGTVTAAEWPVFLVTPAILDPSKMATLLALDGISGLVLTKPSAASAVAGNPRIGIITDDGSWTLPRVEARSLLMVGNPGLRTGPLLFGHPGVITIRRLRTAMSHGITSMILMDTSALWRVVSLRRWLLIKRVERLFEVAAAGLVPLADLRDRLLPGRLATLVSHPVVTRPNDSLADRVLIIASLGSGGAERQAVNTALFLAGAGCDVSFLYHPGIGEPQDFYLHLVRPRLPVWPLRDWVQVRFSEPPEVVSGWLNRLPNPGLAELSGLLPPWVVDDVLSVIAELLVVRPAVVHLWQDYLNVVGGLAALLVGVPRIVLAMRSLAPCHFSYFQPFMAPIYRLLAQQPNVVMLNNSAAGAADYAAWLGIDPAQIRVLHNGVDDNLLAPPPAAAVAAWRQSILLPANARVVGGILRLAPEKNPLLWLETAAVVAKQCPDVHFLLVGDGPLRDEIVHRATALGVRDRLHLPGTVRDIRLPLTILEVLLLTSRVEGLPNVLIEAQMLGCPVVTTLAGGAASAVDQGRTGWVVTDHDPRALAERILQVLNDEEWRRRARGEAMAFARARFGLVRMGEETWQVYRGGNPS